MTPTDHAGQRARLAPAAELIAFLVGVATRLALLVTYNPRMGFDTNAHTQYMQYIVQHGALPSLSWNWVSKHPPLYYGLCAGLHELGLWPGFDVRGLQVLSVLFAVARLAVLWWGLVKFVPSRAARILALLLAAFLPSSVHGDAMVNNEVMNAFTGTLALVLVADAFSRPLTWRRAAGLTAALVAALMTKVTGFLLAPAMVVGLAVQAYATPAGERRRRAAPAAVALLVALAVSLPVYARFYPESGKLISTYYDGKTEFDEAIEELPPYFERRDLGYLMGFDAPCMYERPYFPNCQQLWPSIIATTFLDYYNYSFVVPRDGEPSQVVNYRPLAHRTLGFMRAAFVAGILVALATVAGWGAVAWHALRQRRAGHLAALSVPALVIAGQVHYAIKIPFDAMGLIKGTYLQFGAGPLFCVWGVAVAWLLARGPLGKGLAAVQVAALGALALYCLHAFGLV